MNDISDLATRWGVAAEYSDAFGKRRIVDRDVLAHIVDAVSGGRPTPQRTLPATLVVRRGRDARIHIPGCGPDCHVVWQIVAGERVQAAGTGPGPVVVVPEIAIGTYRLRVDITTAANTRQETATLLVAPDTAFQGRDPNARLWTLAVQLYGV